MLDIQWIKGGLGCKFQGRLLTKTRVSSIQWSMMDLRKTMSLVQALVGLDIIIYWQNHRMLRCMHVWLENHLSLVVFGSFIVKNVEDISLIMMRLSELFMLVVDRKNRLMIVWRGEILNIMMLPTYTKIAFSFQVLNQFHDAHNTIPFLFSTPILYINSFVLRIHEENHHDEISFTIFYVKYFDFRRKGVAKRNIITYSQGASLRTHFWAASSDVSLVRGQFWPTTVNQSNYHCFHVYNFFVGYFRIDWGRGIIVESVSNLDLRRRHGLGDSCVIYQQDGLQMCLFFLGGSVILLRSFLRRFDSWIEEKIRNGIELGSRSAFCYISFHLLEWLLGSAVFEMIDLDDILFWQRMTLKIVAVIFLSNLKIFLIKASQSYLVELEVPSCHCTILGGLHALKFVSRVCYKTAIAHF